MRQILLCALGVSCCALAQTPGSADLTFHSADPGYWMGYGFNYPALDIAFQSNGKAIVGGYFGYWNGLPLYPFAPIGGARAITRLTPDGKRDPSFGPPSTSEGFNANAYVTRLKVLADGSIIAVGDFTSFNGISRNRIVKLTATGDLDETFQVGTGFETAPTDICIQDDGKILLIGPTMYDGVACNRILRLNTNGTRDNTFQVGTGFTGLGTPRAIACNWYGIFIGGSNQMTYNGTAAAPLIRLTSSGARDLSFTPATPLLVMDVAELVATDNDVSALFTNGASMELRKYTLLGAAAPSFTTVTGSGSFTFVDLKPGPSGSLFIAGYAGTVNGQAHGGLVKVTNAGTVDPTFNALIDQQGSHMYAIGIQSDGKVIGLFDSQGPLVKCEGRSKPWIARFTSTGALDHPYSPGYGFYRPDAVSANDMLVQPDGKILVGGSFRSYDQYTAAGLCRLQSDGTWDASFLATGLGSSSSSVHALALQADGKILVGGAFTSFNGTAQGCLLRLNADGTTDNTLMFGTGFDASARVKAIVLQPDGKILLAGSFSTLNGAPCGDVVRLMPNGTIDPSFTGPSVTSNFTEVFCLELATDGRIYIGGTFTALNGNAQPYAARLAANGSIDGTFSMGTGFNNAVYCAYLMPDGRILFGGAFNSYNGSTRNGIASCMADGSVDLSIVFTHSLNYYGIRDIQRQPNGKFLVCGNLSSGDGHRDALRFHPNGQVDDSFHTEASSYDYCQRIAYLPSGKVLLLGPFMRIGTGGVPVGRNGIARLHGGDPQVRVSPKMLLDGSYVEAAGTMTDGLRTTGLLPLTEPYSALGFAYWGNGAGGTTTNAVLNATGSNAIVDWVVVELRDSLAPSTVLASRAALLQRDGDVVDLDGTSAVLVNGNAQKYRVAVRHRNHLAVMTNSPLNLSTSVTTTIDFTSTATTTYGTAAQKQVGAKMVMWAGDCTGNGALRYTGSGNDRDPIILAVGGNTPNATVSNVYDRRDTNLDGVIKYTGTANDRDIILANVGSTTPNNTRTQQLP